jgi:hypothetical protein
MECARTAHNRTVYASPPSAARGSVSLGRFAPTLNSTHIFASSGNLRFPLSSLQKRHIQPERYAQWSERGEHIHIKKLFRNQKQNY